MWYQKFKLKKYYKIRDNFFCNSTLLVGVCRIPCYCRRGMYRFTENKATTNVSETNENVLTGVHTVSIDEQIIVVEETGHPNFDVEGVIT